MSHHIVRLNPFALFLFIATSTLAHAHFVFAVPEEGGAKAHIFISESLKPDPAVDFGLVSGTKLQLRDAKGKDTPLTLTKGSNTFTVPLSGTGTRVLHGITDLGNSGEGRPTPYILIYHPKTILGDAFDAKSVLGNSEPVELIPQGKPGAVQLKFLAAGKPVADSEITVIQPDGKEKKVKTDAMGLTPELSQTGRYGAWARFWEKSAGERDGKKYDEIHHYATIVFDAEAGKTAINAPKSPATMLTKLPEASASLGAVVAGDYLYVYGGHVSPTHSYFTEAVSGKFSRVSLKEEPTWETLAAGPAVQGMNLTAYKGKVYRAGGMMPMNKKGTPSDNHSIPDVARYDTISQEWEKLPPMPEGRSSHDVAVVGDKLIIVGGWTMNGKGKDEKWMDTTLVMDLASVTPAWKEVPQPFKRRAFMAAAYAGKVYVIGGMDENDEILSSVKIFDPKTNTWTDGPELPVGGQLSFAPAATVHKGALYVSIADGTLLRLSKSGPDAGKAWDAAGKATPRLAHRIASYGDTILIIGGAMNGKNSDLVEAITIR